MMRIACRRWLRAMEKPEAVNEGKLAQVRRGFAAATQVVRGHSLLLEISPEYRTQIRAVRLAIIPRKSASSERRMWTLLITAMADSASLTHSTNCCGVVSDR